MQKRNNGVINAVKIMGCPLRQPIFTEARSGIVDYESGLQPLTPPQSLPLTPPEKSQNRESEAVGIGLIADFGLYLP